MTWTPGLLYFFAVLSLVVLERLVEMTLSARNARRVAKRGAIAGETRGFFAAMVLAHALFLAAGPLEVVLFDRPFLPPLAAVATLLLVFTMALRYWAIAALGDRWNTRVLVVPGEPPVERGPYRWIRHPNYLAVIVEVAALPLVHAAWLTALGATLVNALLLTARIRHEEHALEEAGRYRERFGERPRFLPGEGA